jgi:hypothetical protein
VIKVRREDDVELLEDEDEEETIPEDSFDSDIEVSDLGELRALTICSYAHLTERS